MNHTILVEDFISPSFFFLFPHYQTPFSLHERSKYPFFSRGRKSLRGIFTIVIGSWQYEAMS